MREVPFLWFVLRCRREGGEEEEEEEEEEAKRSGTCLVYKSLGR